jgi:hypothetical protein
MSISNFQFPTPKKVKLGSWELWSWSVVGVLFFAACSQPSSPQIRLDTTNPNHAVVEVSGISRRDLARLSQANLTSGELNSLLRVSVASRDVAVAGRYVVGDSLRFVPMFPFDPGRQYDVVFDPARLPNRRLPDMPRVSAVVSLPAPTRVASTVVEAVYPSGDAVPENLLRMYIQFSAPMGLQSTIDHLSLVDGEGRELTGALLPLDTELWSHDRTRATVLFDPGRVKRDILPNREMGRPLRSRRTFTLVVKSSWTDAQGMPLKSEFRKAYRVGPADERALSTKAWRVTAPAAGGRDPLVVTFPKPLDRGLLQRALSVAHAGTSVEGETTTEANETRWVFVPRTPWAAGEHTVVVQPILEDASGNRIGRAFEVMSSVDAAAPERTEPYTIPFSIR